MWPLGFLWDARAEWLKHWVETLSAAQVLAASVAFVVSTVVIYLLFAERIARWIMRLGDWLLRRGA
jgi:Na+/phosphate symporter